MTKGDNSRILWRVGNTQTWQAGDHRYESDKDSVNSLIPEDNDIFGIDEYDDAVDELPDAEASNSSILRNKGENILVDCHDLTTCIEENFVCRKCVLEAIASESTLVDLHKPTILYSTRGYATKVSVLPCKCNDHLVQIVPARNNMEGGMRNGVVLACQYAINSMAVLMIGLLGKGPDTLKLIFGCLGVRGSINTAAWKDIEREVGRSQIQITKKCMEDNLGLEIEATLAAGEKPRADGRVGLNVATDMAWQQRGSARSYNSMSGHNIGDGGYTN